MGKKKTGGGAGLGRALIKERLHTSRGKKKDDLWVRLLSKTYLHCPDKCRLSIVVLLILVAFLGLDILTTSIN